MFKFNTSSNSVKWIEPFCSLIWLSFLFLPYFNWGGKWHGNWSGLSFRLDYTLAAIAVFVPLYFWSFYKRGPALWAGQSLMVVLGTLLVPFNPGAHTFYVYAALPYDKASNKEAMIAMYSVLAVAFAVFQYYSLPGAYFGLITGLIVGIGSAILGQRVAKQSKAKVAVKDVEIARLAKVAERERIARDLHDLLGHTLSLIAIKSELAHRLASSDSERAAAEMREVAGVARSALTEVRQTISGLRSMGLLDAMRAAEAMLASAGIDTSLNVVPLPALNAASEHALAQVVLEACTNVTRHANASKVDISLSTAGGQLVLTVTDNGKGGELVPGNGLTGMRERLEAVSGALTMTAQRPGIRLQASVPLVETTVAI